MTTIWPPLISLAGTCAAATKEIKHRPLLLYDSVQPEPPIKQRGYHILRHTTRISCLSSRSSATSSTVAGQLAINLYEYDAAFHKYQQLMTQLSHSNTGFNNPPFISIRTKMSCNYFTTVLKQFTFSYNRCLWPTPLWNYMATCSVRVRVLEEAY